jgi:hypothetical protein
MRPTHSFGQQAAHCTLRVTFIVGQSGPPTGNATLYVQPVWPKAQRDEPPITTDDRGPSVTRLPAKSRGAPAAQSACTRVVC